MSRIYTKFSDNEAKEYLNALIDKNRDSEYYKKTMYNIGHKLGVILNDTIAEKFSDIYFACTAEDADFLAKGMVDELEKNRKVYFSCFWNQRFSPFELPELKVAPILRKYKEKSSANTKVLILAKSVISGACVVKTNLTDLIKDLNPDKIYISSPVIFCNSKEKLENEFPKKITEKFEYVYFAEDNEKNSQDELIPGIGGNVYVRLGFLDQEDKNKFTPDIVKSRRIAA